MTNLCELWQSPCPRLPGGRGGGARSPGPAGRSSRSQTWWRWCLQRTKCAIVGLEITKINRAIPYRYFCTYLPCLQSSLKPVLWIRIQWLCEYGSVCWIRTILDKLWATRGVCTEIISDNGPPYRYSGIHTIKNKGTGWTDYRQKNAPLFLFVLFFKKMSFKA